MGTGFGVFAIDYSALRTLDSVLRSSEFNAVLGTQNAVLSAQRVLVLATGSAASLLFMR
jgi:vancomycin permeability regulator SanA